MITRGRARNNEAVGGGGSRREKVHARRRKERERSEHWFMITYSFLPSFLPTLPQGGRVSPPSLSSLWENVEFCRLVTHTLTCAPTPSNGCLLVPRKEEEEDEGSSE